MLFYVNSAWRRELQHIPLLYPFWGNPLIAERTPFQHALFERHGFDKNFYRITDNPASADMALMPYSHNTVLRSDPALLETCIAESKKLGLPLLIDGIGDVENTLDDPNVFILRYGGYRFLRTPQEVHILPYADDLLEIYKGGQLSLRAKSKTPSISFAGWASLSPKQTLRTMMKELPERLRGIVDSNYRACKKGVFFRKKAITILEKSPLIQTHFLARTSYSGHSATASKSAEVLRREFVDNLLQSDYGLDIRGDANASTRLPEMLSLGCVPIIVDTERNFPFSDVLDYRTFSLVVDFRQLSALPQIIADFHARLTEEEFQTMQKNARAAYRNYFRVDALTCPLMETLRKKIAAL